MLHNRNIKIPTLCQTRGLSCPASHRHPWAGWADGSSALWHPRELSMLSNPCRTFHPSVCTVAFWTHVKKFNDYSIPWSKLQSCSARRVQNSSFYCFPTRHLLVYLTPPYSLDQRSQCLLPYSFFPGQSWFYTPLSHPPSVYLPCRQESPSLLNPSPHGSCFIPLIPPVTLFCTNSAASFGQRGDGNHAQWRLTPYLRSSTLISLPVMPKSLFFCPPPPFKLAFSWNTHFSSRISFLSGSYFSEIEAFCPPLSAVGCVVVAQARFPAQLGRGLETSKLQNTWTKPHAWGEIDVSVFALDLKST